ncbi:hypothetical protein [Pontiella sulfatireligans]|uniref:Uncharacterized protein n=1 Tax=Pontiella sulfatireligans TaxID=2750658 RepID=A0A6C2UEQ2_9BACT|nr:hypothetical protein [Pontiella sulfatireligans]VGO18692.1 hypothetical protein SCARR_00745 [Pontiella sulfatireligans]
MKKLIFTTLIAMGAGLALADGTLTVGAFSGETQSKAVSAGTETDLTWDIGETLTMSCDVTVSNGITWKAGVDLCIGMGDDSQGIGFGISPNDGYWNSEIDTSAGNAGTFAVSTWSTSARETIGANILGTTADLQADNDQAYFVFEALRTGTSNYTTTTTWYDIGQTTSESIIRVITNGVVATYHEVLVRINKTAGNVVIENMAISVEDTGVPGPGLTSASSMTSLNGADMYVPISATYGGDLIWDIGETFLMTCDITVTDPDLMTGGGQPTIAFGVGDNSEGIGFGIGMWDASKDYLNTAIDADATSGGNFGPSLSSSSARIAAVIPDANDLRDDGETASFAVSMERVDIDTYDCSVVWAGVTNTWLVDAVSTSTNDTVDTFHELLLRVNESGSTLSNQVVISNIELDVIQPTVFSDPYDGWATANGVSGGKTGDDDNDGLNNFGEYVFDGIATGATGVTNQGVLPMFDAAAGDYVFSVRADDNLSCYVLTTAVLEGGSWATNAGPVAITETDGAMDSYTNTVGTSADKLFIKLSVQQD